MNSVHDLGGMHGFGAVVEESDEPLFHTPWEKEVFAMSLATLGQGLCNLDEFRHGIERMGQAEYLQSTYYEHWLAAMERVLVEKGVIEANELAERQQMFASDAAEVPIRKNAALADQLVTVVKEGALASRDTDKLPVFQPGDEVLVKNFHPAGHTRCPRYVRSAQGTIDQVHGAFIYPDTHAHGLGEQPDIVYTVRFEAKALWGDDYAGADSVYIDLWERYLEAA